MIYKFKCSATADLLMMGPQGDALLALLGRQPSEKGIIEAEQLPGALETLRAALARAEPERETAGPGRLRAGAAPGGEDDAGAEDEPAVSLARRLWPVIRMFERAAAARAPVVWGV